ncbi:hypothetical protein [Wolbachia endosymbiont of Mansonella perstans]|nr:hypothetical protein [Wolbachia endosymbiont of Mansonella perstans]
MKAVLVAGGVVLVTCEGLMVLFGKDFHFHEKRFQAVEKVVAWEYLKLI